jgi:hypothetical protein
VCICEKPEVFVASGDELADQQIVEVETVPSDAARVVVLQSMQTILPASW